MNKVIVLAIIAIVIATALILGLTAYSYTQIYVTFSDVSSVEIELEELSWSNLIKLGLDVLSGNWMDAALDVIAGINLGLIFELSNNGLLPVYIPELSYDLSINDIPVGAGSSEINITLNPGETKEFQILQNFQKNSFPSAIESVIISEGIMNIGVSGIAYFELLGATIPIPFESKRQISIVDELENQLQDILD